MLGASLRNNPFSVAVTLACRIRYSQHEDDYAGRPTEHQREVPSSVVVALKVTDLVIGDVRAGAPFRIHERKTVLRNFTDVALQPSIIL